MKRIIAWLNIIILMFMLLPIEVKASEGGKILFEDGGYAIIQIIEIPVRESGTKKVKNSIHIIIVMLLRSGRSF